MALPLESILNMQGNRRTTIKILPLSLLDVETEETAGWFIPYLLHEPKVTRYHAEGLAVEQELRFQFFSNRLL